MTRPLPLLALSAALLAIAPPAFAQDVQSQVQPQPPASPDQEERDRQAQEALDASNIVVTGMRVRQGGAQDITHFRSVAADVGMPRPESLTIEGLMGEHDLT